MSNQEYNIALFIDIENFIGSAATLGLTIDVSKVIIKLREIGRVRIRKAYGDMQKTLQSVGLSRQYYDLRKNFHANLIDIEDIPYLTPNKNTADIKLSVEALSIGYQNPYITHFAILASDRDYVPLYQKLQELDKKVITIGIDQMRMNPMIREASDRLFYYEHLFLGDTVSVLYETEEQNSALREDYFELLERSIEKLERDNVSVSAEMLLEFMRNSRSDFDFALIGCKSFSQFLKLSTENGYIEEKQDHTFRSRPKMDSDLRPTNNIATGSSSLNIDFKKEAKIYKKLLSETLKIPFPNLEDRRSILREIRSVLNREFGAADTLVPGKDGLTLNEIADLVLVETQEKGMETGRNVIYKITFGLYIARCFYAVRNEAANVSSVQVTGLAKPFEVWEDDLHRVYITQLQRALHNRQLKNAGLADFLYGNTEEEALRKVESLKEVG